MSKQVNVRIPDDVCKSIEDIMQANNKKVSFGKFINDAIALYMTIEENMDHKNGSRLVIENAKNLHGPDYKLLIQV